MAELRTTRTADDVLDALGAAPRRKLLVALLETNSRTVSPSRVADAEPEADVVDRLVKMNHVHLPKLEAYGFIDWDPETHGVSRGRNFDEVRLLLELLADHEDELPQDWL